MNGFLIDLHCHTKEHSYDGRVAAKTIVRELVRRGFSGVVLTDHNYVWPVDELEELRAEAELPDDFLLLSGQEVRTTLNGLVSGDLLVYGLNRAYPDGTSPVDIFADVEEAGGFCTAPHPAVPLIGFGAHISSFPVVGVEVWNGRHGEKANAAARVLARAHHFPELSGSDTHAPEDIGGGGTIFEEMPRNLEDIQNLITNQAVRPWQPGMLDAAKNWIVKLKGE